MVYVLRKIPFLEDPTESFIRAASLRVNQWLFTPGQFITRTGDLAHELCYIKYGEVSALHAAPVRRLLRVAWLDLCVVCVLGNG